jgi:hypothetical protein
MKNSVVTPAKAGVQLFFNCPRNSKESWIPAFAGMTAKFVRASGEEITDAA